MAAPKNPQQFLIGDLLRIVVNLDRLGMIADIPVGRILCAAARVTDPRADDAFDSPELGIRSPESAQGKGRTFYILGADAIDLRSCRFRSD